VSEFKPGDEVALASGFTTTLNLSESIDGKVDEAFHPMSVVLLTETEIDISRG